MKKVLIATAALISLNLMPSSASANYYSYQRCMNNGGNAFSCLGELLWDDGSIVAPDIEDQFNFVQKYDKAAVMQSVKTHSEQCDQQKDKERAACYLDGLKHDLKKERVVDDLQKEKAVKGLAVERAVKK
ncbi:hypothetical protein [Pacificibacter marinus]|uniref:Lysozyme inhibitor LprI N-terminal domain-containing protein n=1 Tax=Pacificibacter marinus TaxID=658057 RepID=A0A1Y5RPE9_9RHOB|nr:hypothetical protein [Pacificibacter marinus]SEL31111.1 hypothetical protein SAMN04488032_11721 [Pacificibacter marinus]SLN22297.1 hypothetical protein PAM7971_00670 [Pacificibacter marinus]